MNWICANGKFLRADKPVLMADNRGYRYGDGLFETMKMINGKIILEKFHFERLLTGLKLLGIPTSALLKTAKLREDIINTCQKNKCIQLARVRLSISRGNGGLSDETGGLQYIVECWQADPSVNRLNTEGWKIDIFPGMQKTCDAFSNIKSANFLPYVMAARYAKEHALNDCLVNNINGHIADATIANVFLAKNNLVITPALTEGCVSGVMRRYLIERMKNAGMDVREGVVTKYDLETFDEVFLTNAVNGVRWVKQFRKKKYSNTQSLRIYKDLVSPIYS